MRAVGVVLGMVLFGGLIVLSIAGVRGAVALLVTAVGMLAMLALGGIMGGRR